MHLTCSVSLFVATFITVSLGLFLSLPFSVFLSLSPCLPPSVSLLSSSPSLLLASNDRWKLQRRGVARRQRRRRRRRRRRRWRWRRRRRNKWREKQQGPVIGRFSNGLSKDSWRILAGFSPDSLSIFVELWGDFDNPRDCCRMLRDLK